MWPSETPKFNNNNSSTESSHESLPSIDYSKNLNMFSVNEQPIDDDDFFNINTSEKRSASFGGSTQYSQIFGYHSQLQNQIQNQQFEFGGAYGFGSGSGRHYSARKASTENVSTGTVTGTFRERASITILD
ncbi:unnamed protein product [Caenorhabditis angaria]|uniref:Uncharacterized protein n=1 Tax=Caenorhabditis angaria TaxID=860376 RepID=A0A9P1MT94_9PELO|nr:unnamed protein product [Caenorhabditis angaria]